MMFTGRIPVPTDITAVRTEDRVLSVQIIMNSADLRLTPAEWWRWNKTFGKHSAKPSGTVSC